MTLVLEGNQQTFEDLFTVEWEVLENRFRVQHNPEVMFRYLEELEPELGIPQMQEACRKAFRYNRFFPSPQELIDYALGSAEDRANDAWDAIMERFVGGSDTLAVRGTLEHQILVRVGGSAALREGDGFTRRDMRKEFVRRYMRVLHEGARSLPPVVDEQPVDRTAPRQAEPLTLAEVASGNATPLVSRYLQRAGQACPALAQRLDDSELQRAAVGE